MATHSSVLSWRIPWTEEPGGLQSGVRRKESDTTERLTLSLFTGGAIVVKNLPANAGDARDRADPCIGKNPLEEGMATHSSILAWRIPQTEEPGGLQSMGSQRVGHN